MFTPIGNVDPDPGEQLMLVTKSTSVAVAVNVVVPVIKPVVTLTTILDGHLMVGEVVSTTLTLNEQFWETYPTLSVAEQLTIVVPYGNQVPEGGQQVVDAIPDASLAPTAHVALAV